MSEVKIKLQPGKFYRNPVVARLAKTLSDWEFSSFSNIVLHSNDTLNREMISWFGDLDHFKHCHDTIEELKIEDPLAND